MHCWRGVLIHSTFVLTQPLYLAVRYLFNHEYFSTTHPSWFAITFVSWTYIVIRISIPFFTSPLRYLPSPPVTGFLRGHLNFNGGKPPTDIIARMREDTPNNGLLVLWGPLYMVSEIIPTQPDTLMEVLNIHNYDWEKLPISRKLLSGITGKEGLIIVESKQHKDMRKVVAPAFTGHHIRDLVPLFYGKGLDFADSLAGKASKSGDGVVEMMSQMSRVTLDIIGAAGVGTDLNTIENDDNTLAKLYATITDENRGPIGLFLLVTVLFPPWLIRQLRGTIYAKIANAQQQLRSEVRALVQEKKRLMLDKTEQQKDIIAIIMRSGDFSDDYLIDQLLTFLAAGHDTTASALTWTSWLLATHPDVQDRLRAECNARLNKRSQSEVDATAFDTETMPYLTAVCNETLRLYPAAPQTGRHAVKDTNVGTQFIPKGTRVMMSPWAINHSPALWGADATKYNPDRWLDGTNAANGGAKSPYALLTFLHGPRSCIGQSFARMEMKCLLAALVMRFRFEIANPDEEVEVGGFVIIKPRNGLRLRLHDLRQEAGAGAGAGAQVEGDADVHA